MKAHIFYEDQGNGFGKITAVEIYRAFGDVDADIEHYSRPYLSNVEIEDPNEVFYTKRVRLSDLFLVDGGPGYPPTAEEKQQIKENEKQVKVNKLNSLNTIEELKTFIKDELI